jgi:diacylglycerol O-acyltransferase 2, plant
VFGETEIFRCWTGAMPFRRWIVKTFRVAPIVFWGRFLGVPYQVPVTTVTGPPIPVKKVSEPTHEQVDQLHACFLTAIRELFDREKVKHGLPASEQLTIL